MVQATEFGLLVSATVLEALGSLLTAWRIYFRLRIHRFWWEDAWAAVMLVTCITSIVAYWIYLLKDGWSSFAASWVYCVCFTCILALARLSVLFSIIRINHGCPRLLRAFTYACVAFFVASWGIVLGEKAWRCVVHPFWRSPTISKPYYVAGRGVLIFEFTSNCIAVVILVVLPLRMLWRVKLPKRQRRMILSIFASSVVLALGALFHAVGEILKSMVLSVAGMHVEVCLSIIICNLLVVVTYTYRFMLHDEDDSKDTSSSDDDDFTTPPRSPVRTTTLALTTIDLELSLSSNTGQQRSTQPVTIDSEGDL